MADYSITVTIRPPDGLSPERLNRALERGLNRAALIIEARAKDNLQSHVVTGRLRSSVNAKRATPRGVKITSGTNVKYAPFVEHGTKPHVIRPRTKKALHWGGANGPFAKSVNHPGTKAVHYMKNAADRSRREVASVIGQEIKRGLLER